MNDHTRIFCTFIKLKDPPNSAQGSFYRWKMYREQVNLHDTSLKYAITEHFGDGKTIATYLSPFQQAFSTKNGLAHSP